MSAPTTTAHSSSQECSPRSIALREHTSHVALTCIYNTRAEIELSQPDISLGAIASLPYVENPTLGDFNQAFPGKATLWVISHISLLNAASGASNRMDEPSLNLCALDIVNSFSFITMGEFCVFCARMRSLKYVRKRSDYVFSSDTIMMGLREFVEDRRIELIRYEREHKTVIPSNPVTWEEARQTEEYKRIFNELSKEETPKPNESVIDNVKQIVREVRPAMMSEKEFVKRRDEQIAKLKEKYKTFQGS